MLHSLRLAIIAYLITELHFYPEADLLIEILFIPSFLRAFHFALPSSLHTGVFVKRPNCSVWRSDAHPMRKCQVRPTFRTEQCWTDGVLGLGQKMFSPLLGELAYFRNMQLAAEIGASPFGGSWRSVEAVA